MISDFLSELFDYVLLDAVEKRNRERKKGEPTDVTIRWTAKSIIRPIKSYKREHTFHVHVGR